MSESLLDTIVALATPPGIGALAVVRVSGPGAGALLLQLAPALDEPPPARQATVVDLAHPETDEALDSALVTWFPGPASYTGEDVVEFSTHGGFLVPALVVDACRTAGARTAEPGEFTRRAYLNGRVDLVQAEAIADLIQGRSRALHRAALRQLDRGLSMRIAALRESLLELEALLAHHLDFPEEDEPPVPVAEVVRRARTLGAALEELLETAPEGELLRRGALAVLAGRPNVGKSSLFNALIGEDRVLVTEVPGTTRDAVEVEVSVDGFPFRLVDTAGLREAGGQVERLGIEVARRFLAAADVVLFCVEAGRSLDPREERFLTDEVGATPVVLIRTKPDRDSTAGIDGPAGGGGASLAASEVAVSALTGVGLADLRAELARLVYGGLVRADPETPVLTRERQARGVRRARDEVGAFADALERGVPAEVASAHVRAAETSLEDVLGPISAEDVLERVFASFCVGK